MNIKNYFTPIVIMLILLAACAVHGEQTQNPPATDINIQLPTVGLTTDLPAPTSTSSLSITDIPKSPRWTKVDNWTPANQIRTILIDRSGDL